jgi:hypothetical protein
MSPYKNLTTEKEWANTNTDLGVDESFFAVRFQGIIMTRPLIGESQELVTTSSIGYILNS